MCYPCKTLFFEGIFLSNGRTERKSHLTVCRDDTALRVHTEKIAAFKLSMPTCEITEPCCGLKEKI